MHQIKYLNLFLVNIVNVNKKKKVSEDDFLFFKRLGDFLRATLANTRLNAAGSKNMLICPVLKRSPKVDLWTERQWRSSVIELPLNELFFGS